MKDTTPVYSAFEVDDFPRRRYWVFALKENEILLFDSTKRPPVLNQTFSVDHLPFNEKTLKSCFARFLRRAMDSVNGISFMRYVDPETFEPVDDEKQEND